MKNVNILFSFSYWIYNYLCNQCLSPLMLWVRIPIRARCTTLCDKVCQWLVTGQWFSLGPLVSSTNKTYRHDISEILLKVALNTIKQTNIKRDITWIMQRWNPTIKIHNMSSVHKIVMFRKYSLLIDGNKNIKITS